jgi:hypothetical protein
MQMSQLITNLGGVLTVLLRAELSEIIMHEDVVAWGAPSECHADVSRGEERRMREACEKAERLAGAPMVEIARQAKERGMFDLDVGPQHDRALGRMHAKRCPFCRV